jgi:hypothetical protein
MQILQVTELFLQARHCGHKVTVIVFVIAYNVDHVIELCSTGFKESMISMALGMLAQQVMHIAITKITCNTDIAAENQYIRTICVVDF